MPRKFSELTHRMSPARREAIAARVRKTLAEMPLGELRRARELTQETLATAMETTQGEISKIEQRTDCYVSTLRSYISAMGGELEIVARFPDGQVKVTQFSEPRTGTNR